MKMLTLTLVPWKWEGAVVVGGTPASFSAFAKKYCDADVSVRDGSIGHAYVQYGVPWLLWVESLQNIPTLAHEALHVVTGVLEGRGLKYTADSEEAVTYTLEDLLRQTLTKKRWQTVRG